MHYRDSNVYTKIDLKQEVKIMFELIKFERQKKNYKQITLTIDKGIYEELEKIAQITGMTFHGLIKSILFSFLQYKKPIKMEEENQMTA